MKNENKHLKNGTVCVFTIKKNIKILLVYRKTKKNYRSFIQITYLN